VRKFLVVVDSSPECLNALRFSARRAQTSGGVVTMLYIVEPEEFSHWVGVGERMRAEAIQEAQERLDALCDEVFAVVGARPEKVIREGKKRDEVLALIKEDSEIGILVLGASADGEGPGPLVTALAGQMSGELPVPVTVVPGAMTLEHIDVIT